MQVSKSAWGEFLKIKEEIEKIGIKLSRYEIYYSPQKKLEKELYTLFPNEKTEIDEDGSIIVSNVRSKKIPEKVTFIQSYAITSFIYMCKDRGVIVVNYKNKEFSVDDMNSKRSEKVTKVLTSLGYKPREFATLKF